MFKDQLAGAPGFARYMLRPIGEIGLDLTRLRKYAKHNCWSRVQKVYRRTVELMAKPIQLKMPKLMESN